MIGLTGGIGSGKTAAGTVFRQLGVPVIDADEIAHALVATGDVEGGVEIVRGVEGAEGRLDGQAWYRYWVGEDYRRAADAWRAVVLLNPDNERAAGAMEAAAAKAGDQ